MQFIENLNSISELRGPKMLEIYSRCGMGDVLILRDFLFGSSQNEISRCDCCGSPIRDPKKNEYLHYHIIFYLTPLTTRVKDGDPTYIEDFLKPFMTLLFSDIDNLFVSFCTHFHQSSHGDSGVYYEFKSNHESLSEEQAYKKITIPDLSNILFKNFQPEPHINALSKSNYICVSTRYRMFSPMNEKLAFFKMLFYDKIINTNIKVVLIGEKSDSYDFQSSYSILKNIIPSENLIDCTTNTFFLKNAITDAFLFKNSLLSLCFGIGGIYVIGSYTHSNILSYTDLGEHHPFVHKSKTSSVFGDIHSFCREAILQISKL